MTVKVNGLVQVPNGPFSTLAVERHRSSARELEGRDRGGRHGGIGVITGSGGGVVSTVHGQLVGPLPFPAPSRASDLRTLRALCKPRCSSSGSCSAANARCVHRDPGNEPGTLEESVNVNDGACRVRDATALPGADRRGGGGGAEWCQSSRCRSDRARTGARRLRRRRSHPELVGCGRARPGRHSSG